MTGPWSDAHYAALHGGSEPHIASMHAANLSMMVEVPAGLRDLPPVVTLREFISILAQAVGTPLADAISSAPYPPLLRDFCEAASDAMDDLLDAFDNEIRKQASG